jgi:hypothetical protein
MSRAGSWEQSVGWPHDQRRPHHRLQHEAGCDGATLVRCWGLGLWMRGGWGLRASPGRDRRPSGRGGRSAEHYLLCDDVAATGTALQAEGIEVAQPISHQSWGLLTAIPLPGGVELGLYEPRHRTAAQPSRAHRLSRTISACR